MIQTLLAGASKTVCPSPLWSQGNHRTTAFRIDLANPTLSAITDVNLGDGLPMSSRASLTAAMKPR
jgi:hypothetical protein